MGRQRKWISLPGSLTIVHMLLCVGVVVSFTLLADSIWEIHPSRVPLAVWALLILAERVLFFPLVPISIETRYLPSIHVLMIFLVANSCLWGFGLAGLYRLFTREKFGLRHVLGFLLVFQVVFAIYSLGIGIAWVFLHLAALGCLLYLSWFNIERKPNEPRWSSPFAPPGHANSESWQLPPMTKEGHPLPAACKLPAEDERTGE